MEGGRGRGIKYGVFKWGRGHVTDLSTSGLHFLPMCVGSQLQRRGGGAAVTAQPALCSAATC